MRICPLLEICKAWLTTRDPWKGACAAGTESLEDYFQKDALNL